MGAVPKSRVGPRRKRLRRTHYKAHAPTLARCDRCRSLKPPHVVCPECGTFRGVEILVKTAQD